MRMDIPSLLSVLDDTEPTDQSTRVNQIPLIGKSYHLNTSSRALAGPTILTGDAAISGAWMNSRLQERISFWSSIHGKRNPVCDSIAYGPLGAYQARNLLQSSFHSGTGLFLLEPELDTIIQIGDGLIQRDLHRRAGFVFQRWSGSCSAQHILGFPSLEFETWQDACSTFFIYLQSLRDEISLLAQFRRRMAQVWFWLFFDILCEQSMQKNDLKGSVVDGSRDVLEDVQHQLLALIYPGYTCAPWGEICKKALRDHLRRGFRWWKLACSVGDGALLIASDGVALVVYVVHSAERMSTDFDPGTLRYIPNPSSMP
jgi:hypothetical protein